jgi:hypothetical protein
MRRKKLRNDKRTDFNFVTGLQNKIKVETSKMLHLENNFVQC